MSTPLTRIVRPALLLVAGILVGHGALAVAAPSAPQANQTRISSCAGYDFHPIDHKTEYTWDGRMIMRTSDKGDGWFMCAADLPHRAVVTKVRFTILDHSDITSYEYCGLVRIPLSITGAAQTLALAVSGTGFGSMPGARRYSTTSIERATIDNGKFAYSFQCQARVLDGFTSISGGGGIVGADVTYTISAANG
jgi:hypothetical protein